MTRERMLKKRKTELEGMLKRLLDAFLSGMIEEDAYQTRQAELKTEIREVERELEGFEGIDPKAGEMALSVFDFSQNLAEIWRGSNFATRREILDCISLNRVLSSQGLDIQRRSPFDLLTKGAFLDNGRGDRI